MDVEVFLSGSNTYVRNFRYVPTAHAQNRSRDKLESYNTPKQCPFLRPNYILAPTSFVTLRAWLEKPGGGTGRDLPLRVPLFPFPGCDLGDPIYNENGPFLLLLNCFFSNCNNCIGGFGPFETLEDPFPRGPPLPRA